MGTSATQSGREQETWGEAGAGSTGRGVTSRLCGEDYYVAWSNFQIAIASARSDQINFFSPLTTSSDGYKW